MSSFWLLTQQLCDFFDQLNRIFWELWLKSKYNGMWEKSYVGKAQQQYHSQPTYKEQTNNLLRKSKPERVRNHIDNPLNPLWGFLIKDFIYQGDGIIHTNVIQKIKNLSSNVRHQDQNQRIVGNDSRRNGCRNNNLCIEDNESMIDEGYQILLTTRSYDLTMIVSNSSSSIPPELSISPTLNKL